MLQHGPSHTLSGFGIFSAMRNKKVHTPQVFPSDGNVTPTYLGTLECYATLLSLYQKRLQPAFGLMNLFSCNVLYPAYLRPATKSWRPFKWSRGDPESTSTPNFSNDTIFCSNHIFVDFRSNPRNNTSRLRNATNPHFPSLILTARSLTRLETHMTRPSPLQNFLLMFHK